MAQLVRLDKRAKLVATLFDQNKKRMIAGAPRSTGDPTRIFQIAFNAIAYDDKLIECTQQSLMGGVFEAIKLGVTIGGPMQEAWLVPFKEKGTPTAVLIVGYMGYRNIIDRAGAVIDMHPRAVHVKEAEEKNFDFWYGDQPRIIHRPRYTVSTEAELYAAYCVANLRRGGKQLEVMLKDEIDAHRKRSRASSTGPWVTDYVPMALKTTVRKIAKYLPKSNELLARAMDLDDRADRGVDQELELPPEITLIDEDPAGGGPVTVGVPSTSPMERLKERIGAKPAEASAKPRLRIEETDEERLARENRELDEQIAHEEGQS